MVNCLGYALEFWKQNPRYQIFYDMDHVVNLQICFQGSHNLYGCDSNLYAITRMMPLRSYGYEQIASSFEKVLDENQKKLLYEYFNGK